MDVPIDFLTAGVRYDRPYELPARCADVAPPGESREPFGLEAEGGSLLRRVLAHRDVCSRRPI